MTLQSLIEARQETFDRDWVKMFYKEGNGSSLNASGMWHWRNPDPENIEMFVKAHTTQTIIAILEAQCALLEGRKKQPLHSSCTIEYRGYNSALSEIIASNRALLKTLQP